MNRMRNFCPYPMLPYSAKDFRTWLKLQPAANGCVGLAFLRGSCPGSRWLREVLEKPVRVDYETISVIENNQEKGSFQTPDWFSSFQRRVDDHGKGIEITRRQALYLLTKAENDPDYE